MRELNAQLFQGQPVLSIIEGNVFINTDYILIGNHSNQYISRTFTNDSSTFNVLNKDNNSISSTGSGNIPLATTVQGPSGYADQSNYIEVIASPVEAVRNIVVTIPHGAGPGSILTVAAPNGTTISVVAPPGSYPGKEILVQY